MGQAEEVGAGSDWASVDSQVEVILIEEVVGRILVEVLVWLS